MHGYFPFIPLVSTQREREKKYATQKNISYFFNVMKIRDYAVKLKEIIYS